MKFENIIKNYITYNKPCKQCELDWFSRQSIKSAIEHAATAEILWKGRCIRHSHQRRVKAEVLTKVRDQLLVKINYIKQCKKFDQLLSFIKEFGRSIYGLGDLYIYDTALRIGAKLQLYPDQFYLHAGTRKGAKKLGIDVGKKTTRNVSDLPEKLCTVLRKFKVYEVEGLLCIYKDCF